MKYLLYAVAISAAGVRGGRPGPLGGGARRDAELFPEAGKACSHGLDVEFERAL